MAAKRKQGAASKKKPVTMRRALILAHNHPRLFPGGGELMAYRLFAALNAYPGWEADFVAAVGHQSHEPRSGTAFQSFPGAAREWLFWGDAFDYFFQSQRQLSLLHDDFAALLAERQPDIVHLHHTLRIGVEALPLIRRLRPQARIIYTLHDFLPICHRDGQMVQRDSGALCEASSPAGCHRCFPEIDAARFMARRHFLQTHFAAVDHFISPSHFLKSRYVDWGIEAARITVIENGWEKRPAVPHRALPPGGARNRFAFFGQITPYKGALLLLEAAEILVRRGLTDFHLSLHGNLSLQEKSFQQRFHEALAACKASVTWHGRYEPEALPAWMADCDWVICPSTWWENSPLVIGEAFQHRRPVLCAGIGGMAEKVIHEVNGLHFHAGDAHALADTLARAMSEPALWPRLVDGIASPPNMEDCVAAHLALYEGKGQYKK